MANLFDDLIAAAKAPVAAPAPMAVDDDPPPLAVTVHGNVPKQVAAPAPSTAAPNLFDDVIAAAAAPRGAVISPPNAEPLVPSRSVQDALPPPPAPSVDIPAAVAPGAAPDVSPVPTVASTGVVPPVTYVSPDDMVRSIANGATFGAADKLAARMGSLGEGSPSYTDALAAERAKSDLVPAPARAVGELTGNLLTGGGLAKAGISATAHLAPKAGLFLKSLAGMVDGAGFGAANSLGHTDSGSIADRLTDAGVQGAIGAGVGGSLPMIAGGIGAAYRTVAPAIGRSATSAGDNLSRAARAMISHAAATDGVTAVRVGAMHPEEMLADTGPAMLGLTQGAAANPLEGGAVAISRLNARDQGRTGRLLSDVDANLGPDVSAAQTEADIASARASAVTPHVDAGSAGTVQPGNLADRPSIAKALNTAGQVAADKGQPLGTVFTDEAGRAMPSGAYEGYLAGARRRLDQALQRMLGTGGHLATIDEITARRAAEAAPHYERGFASTIDYGSAAGQRLLALLDRVPANARNAATLIMRMEGSLPEAAEAALVPRIPGASPPAETAPSSLSRFLSKQGGLAPTEDLKHSGITGRVVRKGGMDVDSAREAAAEAGYLPHDSTPNDLMALLDREARGEKVYPAGTSPSAKLNAAKEEIDRETHETAKREVLGAALARNPDLTKIDMDAVDAAAHELAFGTKHTDPLAAYNAATNRTASAVTPAVAAGAAEDTSKLTPAFWDYTKRGLDSMVEGTRNPLTGKVDTVGHAASKLRAELLDALNEAVPDLGIARGIYADESLGLDALELGRKSVAAGVSRERVAREFADLSDHERDLYRLGQSGALRETLARAGDNAYMPARLVGNQQIRDKLATTVAPRELDRFQAAIADEGRHFTESMAATPRAWMDAYTILKDQADRAAPGPARDGLTKALSDLRDMLAANPEFRQALAKGEHFDRVAGALKAGPEAIAGADATHPADLAAQWASFSPAERAAMFKGMRAEIGRRVGTSSNDLVALRKTVGGEGDWNGANLRTIAGDEATDGLIGSVDRESRFANTAHSVTGNSVTATKATSSKMIEDRAKMPEIRTDTSWLGLAKGGLELATRGTYRLLVNASSDNLRRELALALTETGPRRTALVQGILRSSSDVASKAAQIEKVTGNATLARSLVTAATSPDDPSAKRRTGSR